MKMIFSLAIMLFANDCLGQNSDSTTTPFLKGKWISGLSGTISSGTTISDTTTQRGFNNNYGINLSTGRFMKDRLLVGAIFNATRQNSTEIIERNAEQLFVGPLVSYYISKSEQGSLFFSLSPGYSSYLDEIAIVRNGIRQGEKVKGDGFAIYFRFGYAYAIHRRILLELGLNITNSWINAERISFPSNDSSQDKLQLGSLSFSFGFNVLLDDFFF
ncbi:hypothetical protein [Marinigracilibium pacificum]|uniref:Outer membrane protein beta-barrel domain-containing protein n=1 Tax=Marinigracilibium pacificum TaxID=2729599 RepID=A0A848IWG0_9BACT|nr:hypothetical protein [Marinigracilibium pacificum]NMM47601.1 hypothetical protein [Marinigracilibium pacificum]